MVKHISLIFFFFTILILSISCLPSNNDTGNTLDTVDTENAFILTVNIIGNGYIDLSPDPIAEDGNDYFYDKDEIVTLTALTSSDNFFLGWKSVYLSGDTNPAQINMNSNKTVTAYFYNSSDDFSILTIDNESNVAIALDPVSFYNINDEHYYYTNETISIKAEDVSCGITFSHWEGDVMSYDNPLILLLDKDKTIIPVMVPAARLVLNYDEAFGEVILDPMGVVVGDKAYKYQTGITVTLEAVAKPGYTFVEWQDDITGSNNPVDILIDSDSYVTAVFSSSN